MRSGQLLAKGCGHLPPLRLVNLREVVDQDEVSQVEEMTTGHLE